MQIFFFQAEDGIRDIGVTGVQTCALPISRRSGRAASRARRTFHGGRRSPGRWAPPRCARAPRSPAKIGRASCRERVEIALVAGVLTEKNRVGKTYDQSSDV